MELEEIIKKYNLVEKKLDININGEEYRYELIEVFHNKATDRLTLVYEARVTSRKNI